MVHSNNLTTTEFRPSLIGYAAPLPTENIKLLNEWILACAGRQTLRDKRDSNLEMTLKVTVFSSRFSSGQILGHNTLGTPLVWLVTARARNDMEKQEGSGTSRSAAPRGRSPKRRTSLKSVDRRPHVRKVLNVKCIPVSAPQLEASASVMVRESEGRALRRCGEPFACRASFGSAPSVAPGGVSISPPNRERACECARGRRG